MTRPALALLLALGAACAANAQDLHRPATAAKAASVPSLTLVAGEVQEVDFEKGLIVLRHDEIPNIAMEAMTMEFDVADRRLLEGLKAGDKVRFQAAMLHGKATVTELHRQR